jgi:predicted nucleotidyltransferase
MKKGRKYVNRKNLLNLFQPKTLTEILPEIKIKTEKISSIRVEDLCKLFRKCCIFFMKNKSIVSIITSKRISKVARELHLSRRRKVLKALEDYEK